jgi:predicted secreted Zn-dependent protease
MSGCKFTWAKSRRVPTFEKLDRVLVSTEWEQNFPLATVDALSREISDHTPLLLSTGDKPKGGSEAHFRFELGWLLKDGFFELVSDVWKKETRGVTHLQKWQNKIRRLRQFLRGWAKNMAGAYKKEKQELMRKADELDKKAETQLLSQHEWDLKQSISGRLTQLLREEELKWFQRAKTTKILKGDNNTKYFQMVANGKKRKTRISRLEQEEGVVEGHEQLLKYITKYYKSLFGNSERNNFSMNKSMNEDIPQVTSVENGLLEADFSEKEVREAIFQMKHNKTPGPNGFPAEFYQIFWSLIKNDLMALFKDFHNGSLPLFNLNFGIITLLPKEQEVKKIQQYRPICMLNVSFKIFTKVLANRLTSIASKLIKPSQTAFLPGRYILEGVVILHETIHELHRKKEKGIILKLDFEKAYDKVNWDFLQQVLRMKGFSDKWCHWIDSIVRGGSVCVKVNEEMGHYFQTKKGLRQGDPLSPILFNLVADMLAVLIERSKELGYVDGLIPNLVEGGLSILQYADDTILFLEDDLDKAKNLKMVLGAFEKLSGLKINFHKSELFCFGETKERTTDYVNLFECKEGALPFRYLGIPMSYRKLANKEWRMVEERFQKKLSSWKGKLLSYGGRLVLINSVLSSLPVFMMSFFRIPKGVREKLDYYRSRFFWQCDEHKRKYRLARWGILHKPKCIGGLGIIDLELQNKCLLSKWIFKFLNEEGMWQQILKRKYLKDKTFSQVERRKGDSHFWSSLMDVKNLCLERGGFNVKNGTQTRFWEYLWIGQETLMKRFSSLYNLVRKKNASVAQVLSTTPLNVSFRRALVGENWTKWLQLVGSILNVQLCEQEDSFIWSTSKYFSVKAMYKDLVVGSVSHPKLEAWKAKIPLKTKIFLWFLWKGVILTKDNLAKRQWKGCTRCCFCSKLETIQHLFFECPMARLMWFVISVTFGITAPTSTANLFGPWLARFPHKQKALVLIGIAAFCWALWLSRNDMVFQKSKSKSFLQVVFRGTYWIRSWSILSKEEGQEKLKIGCRWLETIALEIFNRSGWNMLKRIQG